jgi:hypothetical protein
VVIGPKTHFWVPLGLRAYSLFWLIDIAGTYSVPSVARAGVWSTLPAVGKIHRTVGAAGLWLMSSAVRPVPVPMYRVVQSAEMTGAALKPGVAVPTCTDHSLTPLPQNKLAGGHGPLSWKAWTKPARSPK